MSRLTNKEEWKDEVGIQHHYYSRDNACLDKLGKLEDLEEQLGCPLDVLFRALKDGIYHDEKFEHPVLILDEDSFKKNNFSLLVVGTIVYLKEYKKTWWLRKDKNE